MRNVKDTETRPWLDLELEDDFDEELEQEIDDARVPAALHELRHVRKESSIDRGVYFRELLRLQSRALEAAGLGQPQGSEGRGVVRGARQRRQGRRHQAHHPAREPAYVPGRRAAGASDRERTQWYFQRYVPHLPAAGEIVLFDRSWYNRAGVERVMGFATESQVEEFFRDVPEFERMLVRSGVLLVKYWFSITDEEQQFRFLMRIHDPIKQWKLSPMDLQSRVRWEQYTGAKEAMFERTNIPEAPWHIVEGNDKKRARLNCIAHLLSLVPYEEVPREPIALPERDFDPNYERRTLPPELYVPERY